jgi:O-antigen/teichoic acid export membrane protein
MSLTTTTAAVASPAPAGLWPSLVRRLQRLAASPLLQKSGLSVFDQAVVSGASFATSVILGRCAPREELGVYYLALSVVFFARGIQEQLVSAPYMIYCHRKQGADLARYAGSALIHQCGIMFVTALLVSGAVAAGLVPATARAAFWLLAAAAPLLLVREFVRQMSFAHLEMRTAIALDVAAAVLQLGLLLSLAASGRLTVTATIAVLAVSSGLPAIAWLFLQRRRMRGRLDSALTDLAHNWPFARWALASQLLACTTPYVMPWVIALTHGESETGLLGACSTLVGLSNTFLMGLCNFLTPRAARAFSEGGVAELRSVLKKTALLFTATLGLMTLAAFALGEQIAVLVYGPQFAGAGLIIGVLALSVLANSFGVTAGNGLWAMERPSANFTADLWSLAAVIGATIAFVPPLGPLGAALATLAGTASGSAVRLWILRQTMHEHTVHVVVGGGKEAR